MSAERPYSYDEVLYPSRAVWYMHPRNMATLAHLLSLEPAPVERCRALELGSGTGGNLLPMAVHLPESTFVGIDRSARQVEQGRNLAAELGVENLELVQGDVREVGADLGEFDYILCHGVYSWVSVDVQDAILRACHDHLAPNGLVAISYNVLPGWHVKSSLHHLLRLLDDPELPADARIDRAVLELRDLKTFLSERKDLRSQLVDLELRGFNEMDRSYFFHEYLESHNEPVYFDAFAARAEAANLRYLGNLLANNGRHAHWLAGTAGLDDEQDVIREEAVRDVRVGRQFRGTLLGHRSLRPQRAVPPERLLPLSVSMSLDDRNLTVDMDVDGPMTIVDPEQKPHILRHGLDLVARALLDASPAALPFETLFELVADVDTPDGPWTRERLAERLLLLYFGYALQVHVDPPAVASEPSRCPKTHTLTRLEARRDEWVTNAWHKRIKLTTIHRIILQFLDGSNDKAATEAGIRAQLESGEVTLSPPGTPAEALLEVLPEAVQHFTKLGLLLPPDASAG